MNSIQIHRPGHAGPLLTLPLDDNFVFSAKQMGEQNVRFTVSSASPLDLRAGDRIDWDGVPYSLPGQPDCKHADGTYSYDLTFQSPGHRLSYLLHKDEGSLTFPYDGNLAQQLDALYTSVGREASGFTVEIEEGIENASQLRHIEYDKTYCLDALTRICEEFGTEWRIDGFRIRIGRWKAPAAGEFRYGRGKGLYSLEKIGVSNTSIVTRLYGFGSADNLPAGYRAQNLVFSGEGGQSCLEKNTAAYGIREEAVTFDDICPRLTDARLGSVTVPADIAAAGSWTVTLSLPADCGDLTVEKDKEARIKFTTGALMGEAFTVTRLDAATRQLDFNTSDDNGYKLPSPTRQPAAGDEFVLLGIALPQSYVDLAEAELKARTREELDRRCEKNCAYRLDIDPRYVRRQGIRVEVGGTVLVRESDSTEPVEVRVSELSYPLSDPCRLSLVLSDTPVYTDYSEKIENDIRDVTHDVNNVHREARAFSRRAWRDASELAAMLDTLKADLLLVGNHTGQFVVSSTFTANRGNNPDLFHATAGQLRHAVHKGASDGVWYLGEARLDLPASTACYLYAQCSRTGTFAQYRVSAAPIGVEDEEGWYHFPVGIVSSPFEGARVFNTTYGFTQIAGGSITTGKLSSSKGGLEIDLDNGKITGPVILTAGTSLDQVAAWSDLSRKVDTDSQEMVRKNGVISSINLSEESIRIAADKIRLVGDTTLDGILSAGKIKAEYIDADNLTARRLRTSDSGARIEINQEQNVIAGFSPGGIEVFRVGGLNTSDASLSITASANHVTGNTLGATLTKEGLSIWDKANGYGYTASYAKQGIDLSYFAGYRQSASLKPGSLEVSAIGGIEVLFQGLPSGNTNDAHIKALPIGSLFIDSGQKSYGSAMLRIRVE